MIKFDADSIYKRALSRLQDNPEWKAVINNSVIDALLKSNSEAVSEAARYAEYLFKESKWDTAQNDSSILAMAGMLGYKPRRKISATGQLYISAENMKKDPEYKKYDKKLGHDGLCEGTDKWTDETDYCSCGKNKED